MNCIFNAIRCRNFSTLRQKYDNEVNARGDSYISALIKFDDIAENRVRGILGTGTSADQAWKSCKGTLYEYAVCKAIEEIFNKIPELSSRLDVIHGSMLSLNYKNQITIKNWAEILPDVDFAVIDKSNERVKAIISCKTSLRERLTETAFWKREIQNRGIEYVFITTDKDDELRSDNNRYIVMHVLDYTIITDRIQLHKVINTWREKYRNKSDFNQLIMKIGGMRKLCEVLCQYAGLRGASCLYCNSLPF